MSNECTEFTPKTTLARMGVKVHNIWLAKHRLYNVNTAKATEQPTEAFSSTYSQDPSLIDTHRPLVWSIALHCHYQDGCTGLALRPSSIRHRGWRTCHRVSLKFGVIISHKSIFKRIERPCTTCILRREQTTHSIGSPLHFTQMGLKSVFSYIMNDCHPLNK